MFPDYHRRKGGAQISARHPGESGPFGIRPAADAQERETWPDAPVRLPHDFPGHPISDPLGRTGISGGSGAY